MIGNNQASSLAKNQLFKSWFGARPVVCASVWNLLDKAGVVTSRKAYPIHLLIGLFFLKNYCPADKGASDLGYNTKTYQKWSWLIVEELANLDKYVVSHFDSCMFLLCLAS